jgi:hypothetical protein
MVKGAVMKISAEQGWAELARMGLDSLEGVSVT